MPTPRRRRYLRLQLAWLLGALLVLVALGVFSAGAYVLLAVLGFVVVDEVLASPDAEPRWRGRTRKLAAVGLLGAAVVVAVRTIQLVAPGVIP
ncbi:hypothetical protein QA600_21045 [Natronococcus sp. A-GB1]|uniref:hypothetical protein n=1 Tax=Natronococcus sp. A-GB1 TaxID=3037648 RepID=UPI00241E51AD|nr:hypothetical protein [Natronococcus sp. A-GB1]MDG5761813.1 hypothetical protein [Natronococcus sp. A-GB1]